MITPEQAACCGGVCGRGTEESGPCVAHIYGKAIIRRLEVAGFKLVRVVK